MKEEITFINFRKEHGLELIQLWRKSFAQAMGIEEDTREEEVKEHLAYLQTYNPEIIRVALEKNKNKIVGFMAKEEEDFLTLSTFQLNKGAQKFYEFHDFTIARRGFADIAGNTWANNKEQLADITYEWKRVTKICKD